MSTSEHVDTIIATQKKINEAGIELDAISTVMTATLMDLAGRVANDIGEALKILAKEAGKKAGTEVKKKVMGLKPGHAELN